MITPSYTFFFNNFSIGFGISTKSGGKVYIWGCPSYHVCYDDVVELSTIELKQFLINYAGAKLEPEDGRVTVHMIAEAIAAEFPEFLFAIAEENFLRGYQLGLNDATTLETEAEADTGNEE